MFNLLDYGITGRAKKSSLLEIILWDPRDFTKDKHRTVDDRPYGGGPGMLMKAKPLQDAIIAASTAVETNAKVIYFSPIGKVLQQQDLQKFINEQRFILIAGRYEGIDQRLIDKEVDEIWSIGDYVLSGGELAAMVFIDALIRLIPGSLGAVSSAHEDSFSNGLLEFPQYTRPEVLNDQKVPEVLLSGDHQAIARWRLKQSLGLTWRFRADLLAKKELTPLEQTLLDEYMRTWSKP